MGDIEPVAPTNGVPRGGTAGDGGLLQPHPANPEPEAVPAGVWSNSEQATGTILQWIKPTVASERNRAAVVDYVQRLIRNHLGSEVFPFGSVPLKTYLPDGDIDLTAFCFPNAEEGLSNNVRSILKSEELNSDAEFEVKDVQYIHAEVKLVKCLVQNIVVDISFNQIGGLCALCFLEHVDQLIGRNHLFKRSIMLIKAWCYYESRILGAYHGLISTYALETLVLHIFHFFHKTLNGPLAVLYRFLDYYSKFDWENYGVSLDGPVALNRLPDLIVEPVSQGDDLLLKEEFIKECVDNFSVPPRSHENSRVFTRKFFNIVDPLKQTNNLGRSVSKGNFYRIRSAFVFGARKLGRILEQPAAIADQINMFFRNTLERHGSGERPDVLDASQTCSDRAVTTQISSGRASSSRQDLTNHFNGISISNSSNSPRISPRENGFTSDQREVYSPSGRRLTGDVKVLPRSRSLNLSAESGEVSSSSYEKVHSAPILKPENDSIDSGDHRLVPSSFMRCEEVSSRASLSGESSSEVESSIGPPQFGGSTASHYGSAEYQLDESSHMDSQMVGNGEGIDNSRTNLTGDFDSNFRNLMYAHECLAPQENFMGPYILPFPGPPLHGPFRGRQSWNAYGRRNMNSFPNSNGGIPRPPFPPGYHLTSPSIIPGAFRIEETPKTRGTGTYFPNVTYRTYRERPSGRGRYFSHSYQQNFRRSNIHNDPPAEEDSYEYRQPSFIPVLNNHGIPALPEVPQTSHSPGMSHMNGGFGVSQSPENVLTFGTVVPVVLEPPLQEYGNKYNSSESNSQASGSPRMAPGSSLSFNHNRAGQPYQLKDEGDFPPLTS